MKQLNPLNEQTLQNGTLKLNFAFQICEVETKLVFSSTEVIY